MEFYSCTSSDESVKPLDGNSKFVCIYDGCNASFAKNSKLTYHIRRHTGERPFACDEPNCGKTYLFSFHLRRHKDITHSGKQISERILCPHEDCGLELANKYSLKKHIKIKHNPERQYPFNCGECKQGFHRKRELLRHSYIHTGILPYKCETCGNQFLTQRDCNRHRRTHTDYTCNCKKTFERWSSFLEHRKTCESIKLTCNVCNKKFIQQSKLEAHQAKHINEKTYNCGYDNCKRWYLYKKNLIYHINKCHKKMELPKIVCTEPGCQKTLSKMQNLQNHINRYHSGENSVTEKKPRKPRKDKGMPKGSVGARLAGLLLPAQINLDIVRGINVELPAVSKGDSRDRLTTLTEDDSRIKEITSLSESTNINNITENMLADEDNVNITNTAHAVQQEIINIKLAVANA